MSFDALVLVSRSVQLTTTQLLGRYIQSLAYSVDDEGLYVPSTDPSATRETKVLLKSMADVTKMKALMFGHQNKEPAQR